MEPRTESRRALGAAVLIWASSIAVLAFGGLATGVWRISDLWEHAGAAFLSDFGLLTIVSTFFLIGGSVFLWLRYNLIVPVFMLICYVGVAASGGFSGLYIAAMYSPFVLVGLVVLTLVEWVLRTVWPQ
jgi:hypothetical protein